MRAMAAAERPAPTVPRGRHAPPLEVRLTVQRRRLFEAAADVFARVGYAEASAEAISREAGMSKATFYEHFANKEECILALFDEAATEVMRAMVGGVRRRGPRLLRGARGRRRARLPGDARLLSDLGADAARGDHRRRARAPPRAATRSSRPSPTSLYRDNQRAAPQYGAPTFASPDDAFAIIGASVELVSRSLRTGRPADVLALEPVITRLMLGVLHRARDAARPRGASKREVVACRRCPRLVAWREQVAREKRARSPTRSTGAGRCPGFGDPARARARPRPGARRPRRQPHRAACSPATARATGCSPPCTAPASPTSRRRCTATTACELHDAWIAAAVRCAPPANKPTPQERDDVPAVDGGRARAASPTCAWSSASARSPGTPRCACAPRSAIRGPGRGRASATRRSSTTAPGCTLLGCFHPSQQNTFTGRLTAPMLDAVLRCARRELR